MSDKTMIQLDNLKKYFSISKGLLKKNITILQERYLIVCWFFLPYASAGLFLIKKAME